MQDLTEVESMSVKALNFQSILEELEDSFSLPQEDIRRIFEETASEFLSKVLKYDVDFFLEKDPKFYIYKDDEVVIEPVEKLSKNVVRGIIAHVKKELRKKCELELLWKVYVKVKRRIKSLVKGKIIMKSGRDYYVEFFIEDDENPLKPLRLIGTCLYMDTTYSDRKNFRAGLEKYFMIKNCYAESIGNTTRLVTLLSRQSKTFIKKLFVMHGIPEDEIVRVERKPYRVLVYTKNRIPKEIIREVSREIDEGVIVRYGR